MDLQQTSFDFFANTAPAEEAAPAAKPVETKNDPGTAPVAAPGTANEHALIDIAQEMPVVDEQVRDIQFEPSAPVKAQKMPAAKKSNRGRMKLSDMDLMVGLVEVPPDDVLFQKRYYSIGEVSQMFKVNISLVRFWENEFDILKPKKNGKGDRLFRPEDVKNLNLIYHLLREKKYTIDGAKDFLKKNKSVEERYELIETLKKTRAFLLDLKAHL